MAEKLTDYPEVPPPQHVGKAEAVRLLEAPIRRMLEKGYTLKRIAEILTAECGFETTPRTIRLYLPHLRVRPPKASVPPAEPSPPKKLPRPVRPGEFHVRPDRETL
ncbi:MAG: hypothetical protein JNM60_11320 [Candidatus Competibacteraceae bacterium]|nr:hypothetical protein [Candidatus Competibacteraceae bacterium]